MSQVLLSGAELLLYTSRNVAVNLVKRGSFPKLPAIPEKHKLTVPTEAKIGWAADALMMYFMGNSYIDAKQAEMGIDACDAHHPQESPVSSFMTKLILGDSLSFAVSDFA